MLQEDYTQRLWETLLPWQQQREVEVVEDFAEEALERVDMLRLAELPGAFRIYKACLDTSLRSCPEFKEQSWSAVSLLYDLHTFRQQEQNTLAVLCQRLQGESLRLLCFYIRLATLRAHREKMSYRALLAARQSWETWPQVFSPFREEQAALWLCAEEGEREENNFKTLEQKAALQLLVLTQEKERKHLVKLVHGISLEDLEESVTDSEQVTLRAGCVERLRQIHAQLQTNPQTQMNQEWSKHKLKDCTRILLTHLMELQEVQAVALLQDLADRNTQHIKALQDKYEDEIQTQRFTNLLHLLTSDALLTAGSILVSNFNEKSNNKQLISQVESISSGSAEAVMADSIKRTSSKQTADVSNRQNVCSGCGDVMEDLPYLEILCVPNAQGNAHESLASKEEEASAIKSSRSYEKQGSLITLAWSKRPENDPDYETEAADVKTEWNQDVESMKTQVQPTQCKETIQDKDGEELSLKMRPIDDLPHEQQAASKSDQQTAAMVAENRQAMEQHLIADSSEHADDLCPGIPNHTANTDGDETEVEMCPTETESELWEHRGSELSDHEDLTHSKDSTADCSFSESEEMREPSLMERGQERKPVSALEREKTMRNLVDIQRKVEQKQQRDRDRQWLRVQERLSIIQNRKAEEDLLGLKHTDRLRHLTQDLPLEDKNQQKTVVRERLEQLRRERSYIMQSRRDRNTAGFKELLAPVARHSSLTEDEAN
ncbi:uncharacterized protein LOC121647643 [Melanotaenia boesemani]|uniref:uncharacterized protein LOC121647643 n=1 Tax=Melanotaenia boesemani TaxID=1250792 RepID=UPI001C048AA0|nr:uncharacterized protein LOC121647643 [Melanotaenia boesemani]